MNLRKIKLPYKLFGLVGLLLVIVGLVASLTLVQTTQKPEPEAAVVDATDTLYDLGVLVIKYFPRTSDGLNIDLSVTGDVGEGYDFIRQRTVAVTNNLKTSLERATTYLGYKDPSAQPALRWTIIDTKEYTQAVPIKPKAGRITYPDYHQIMADHKICAYVDSKNVREVWLWAYQGSSGPEGQANLNIDESKMSSPFGDFSNSWKFNDMPICSKTYRVYTFNYGRGTAEAIESWGHQLEAEMDAVDSDLFRHKFQGPNYPATREVPGRCGSVHNPPNARWEYDRDNRTSHESDCMDWNPDYLGELSQISCENWGCHGTTDADNPALNAQVWVMQNIPGRGNTKIYQGKRLRNWWDVHGDFDQVMAGNRTLLLPVGALPSLPLPSPVVPTPFPSPVPLTGDVNFDGDLDIFDYNVLVSHFGRRMPPAGSPADFDQDNDVDIFDYNLFIGYYRCRNGCG